MSSNEILSQFSNDLLQLVPPDRLAGFALGRLADFSNDFIVANLPQIVALLPNERVKTFSTVDQSRFITDPVRRADLGLSGGLPAPPPGVGGGSPSPAGPTAPKPYRPNPSIAIPDTHNWILEIGAQDIARRLMEAGGNWPEITPSKIQEVVARDWVNRMADPKFKALVAPAKEFFAQTGRWPTEVELNKFTKNLPGVPNLVPSADGDVLMPKGSDSATSTTKWTVPEDKLPPGYEWRFSADGTPVPLDITPESKDVMSGWYMNPTSGDWSYNPLAGAADYLQFDATKDAGFANAVNAYISRTGRLPTLEEARQLAVQLWTSAPPADRARAEQFFTLNGFWPTPYELQFGPAKDTDANASGTGTSGKAGLGQVAVFVPGIGMVMTQGQAMGAGGFVFDPFQGIPGTVRPWVREVLEGRQTIDSLPPEMQEWARFALQKFRDQAPVANPDQIPWGTPSPHLGGPDDRKDSADINKDLDERSAALQPFIAAFKSRFNRAPTPEELSNVGTLAQLDMAISRLLPDSVLRRFPNEVLVKFPNDVLLKLGDDVIRSMPNDRILGLPPYQGTGFGTADIMRIVTDPARRDELGMGDFPHPNPNETYGGELSSTGGGGQLSQDRTGGGTKPVSPNAPIGGSPADAPMGSPVPGWAPGVAAPVSPGAPNTPAVQPASPAIPEAPGTTTFPLPNTGTTPVTTQTTQGAPGPMPVIGGGTPVLPVPASPTSKALDPFPLPVSY